MTERPARALAALCLLALAQPAPAQAPVRATTRLHPDGSRTDSVTNPDAKTITETTLDAAGKVMSKVVYATDEKGLPTSSTTFDPKGRVAFKSRYTRDLAGRVTEEAVLSPTGALIQTRRFQYDSKGRLAKTEILDAAGKPVKSR